MKYSDIRPQAYGFIDALVLATCVYAVINGPIMAKIGGLSVAAVTIDRTLRNMKAENPEVKASQ